MSESVQNLQHQLLSESSNFRSVAVRVAGAAVALLLVVIIAAYIRAAVESSMLLQSARLAIKHQKMESAISDYRRAIGWFAPLLSAPKQAAAELEDLIEQSNWSPAEKFLAYNELKRGLYGSRSWFTPFSFQEDALARVEGKIDAYLARHRSGQPLIKEVHPPRTEYQFQLMAQFGFWGWLCAVPFAIWTGFNANGAPRWGRLAAGSGLMLLCFLVWLVGLRFA